MAQLIYKAASLSAMTASSTSMNTVAIEKRVKIITFKIIEWNATYLCHMKLITSHLGGCEARAIRSTSQTLHIQPW